MGYTIRTATHRYTRWVDWPARQTTAERPAVNSEAKTKKKKRRPGE